MIKKQFAKSAFLTAMLLPALFTGGCASVSPQGGSPGPNGMMAADAYPFTQGSNPTRIISERIFTQFTGLDDKEGDYFKIRHTGTSEAYLDFLADDTDIEMIVAQQPDPDTEKVLAGKLFKPIARDALVFITNKDNPVDSLTLEQIKGILSGEVVNWKEVGGKDEPVNLFRRNESGGSQILLDKYVLQGGKLKEVPRENVAKDMWDMSKFVGENIYGGATFGYTTYYFAEYSGKRDDIKTIQINGVKADFDSIQRESYPVISYIYMGIKDPDSPAGEIYEWISTPEGQNLIKATGYVPLEQDALSVVATIFAPYDFAREITGGKASVRMLLPPAAESHSFEPGARDILEIQNCDVFIYVGGASDEWARSILSSARPGLKKTIALIDCVDAVEEEIIPGMEAGEEDDGPEYDEHVWTSPQNAKLIVTELSAAFCEADPGNAGLYRKNTEEYLQKLDRLDAAFQEVVDGAVRKTIVFGDRFPFRYLADAYGLRYFAAFPGCASETEPSMRTIAFLMNKVRDENIPVVFHAELSDGRVADTIGDGSGAKTLLLHACHNISRDDFLSGAGYLDLMAQNAEALKEALW